MATVNLGRIKPVFRGAYSGSTAYVIDDIVTHGDESFICIQAHGAGTQATSVTAYWTKLAAKGTDGTDVGTTITAQGDILYRDGSGLQKLAKPASNKILQNTSGGVLSWIDAPSGVVKKMHSFEFGTRTAGTAATTTQFTFTAGFVPLDPVNNSFYCSVAMPIWYNQNGAQGFGLRFYDGSTADDYFGKGVMYQYHGTGHQAMQGCWFNVPAGDLAAGTFTITLRTESTDSQPSFYCPNSTDDSRLVTQTKATLMITEYKN